MFIFIYTEKSTVLYNEKGIIIYNGILYKVVVNQTDLEQKYI